MFGLTLPFEKAREEYFEATDQVLAISTAHGLKLLNKVLDIHLLKPPLSQQFCGLLRPRVNVALVQAGWRHGSILVARNHAACGNAARMAQHIWILASGNNGGNRDSPSLRRRSIGTHMGLAGDGGTAAAVNDTDLGYLSWVVGDAGYTLGTVVAVPEPTTMSLALLAACGLLSRLHRTAGRTSVWRKSSPLKSSTSSAATAAA